MPYAGRNSFRKPHLWGNDKKNLYILPSFYWILFFINFNSFLYVSQILSKESCSSSINRDINPSALIIFSSLLPRFTSSGWRCWKMCAVFTKNLLHAIQMPLTPEGIHAILSICQVSFFLSCALASFSVINCSILHLMVFGL